MEELDELNNELETTVPTDLTVSSFSDDGEKNKKKKWKTDPLTERRDLVREIQLLKLDISQKNSLINKLRTELLTKTSTLEQKMKDTVHQKQILETRLRAQIKFSEEEFNHKLGTVANELKIIQQKNKSLEEDIQNLKFSLESHTFSENEFEKLKTQPKESETLTEYVMLKIYEQKQNLKKENDYLRSRTSKIEKLLPDLQEQLQACRESLQLEKAQNIRLKEQYSKLLTEHTNVGSRIQRGNYAQENFNRVKAERDQFNNEVLNAKREVENMKAELLEIIREKDNAKQETIQLKQKQALLQQDCETVSQQLSDVTQRWGEAQDKAVQLQAELDRAKTSREELMERFMRSRDQLRVEFEERLALEKNKVNSEAKLYYEQEIRSLIESKNEILRQKNKAEVANAELKKKYEQLFSEYQEKCGKELDMVKQLQRDLTEKESLLRSSEGTFNQLQVTHQEKCKDYDKLSVKLQITEEELAALKKSSFEKVLQLETELGACRARLEVYEKLGNEINEVINEAAQVIDSSADRRLDEVVRQLPLSVNARFTFVKSVSLMRKTLELERKLEVIQEELNVEKNRNKKISDELDHCNMLLNQVEQPYSYLISTIRENEMLIEELNTKVKSQKQQLESIRKEKSKLQSEKNQLMTDLELVLKNRQELSKLKEQVESLKKDDRVSSVNNNLAEPENKVFTEP